MRRLIILLIILMSLVGCTNSTKPKKGTISGTVFLFDDRSEQKGFVDPTGINVQIYSSAPVDTSLIRIIGDFPGLGVVANQHTEFDHRYYNPIAQVQTDGNGRFKFEGITEGLYNIVAEKEGWGWIYSIGVRINENCELTLYPETIIPSYTNEIIEMLSDHHYLVNDNSLVGGLTLNDNVWLRMGASNSLTVNGPISKPSEGYFYICADDPQATMPASVNINGPGSHNLNNVVVRGINNGMRFANSEVHLTESRFDKCQSALELSACSGDITHSVFTGIHGSGQAIGAYSSSQIFTHNLIKSYSMAISLRMESSASCEDSYLDAVICIEITTGSTAGIRYNEMRAQTRAVSTEGPQTFQVSYSNISGSTCFFIGSPVLSDLNKVNYNNLRSGTLYAFANRANPALRDYQFDFRNNHYLGLSDIGLIPQMITDQNDETDPRFNRFYINYLPLQTSRVSQAGIRND